MEQFKGVAAAAAMILLAACASSPTEPRVTHDGLTEVPNSDFGEVYRLPGADLGIFTAFGLENCTVAFRNNWLRDQNRSRLELSNRVTQEDVDKIKDALAEDCNRYFREALLEEPAYRLVDNFSDGQAVLIVRPSIINLDVTAPDVRRVGRTQTYTTSAGEMTLSLDLVDGTTGQVLVRVVDRREDRETYRLEWTNSVSNRGDARRVLRMWSDRLREALDTALAGN